MKKQWYLNVSKTLIEGHVELEWFCRRTRLSYAREMSSVGMKRYVLYSLVTTFSVDIHITLPENGVFFPSAANSIVAGITMKIVFNC